MALQGDQTPTFLLAPKSTSTADADDCVTLAQAYGLVLDPWQRTVCEAWLATGRNGRLTASDAACALPRQNGKNGVVEAVELFKTAVQARRVLHTAHEVKTCRRHFLRMCAYFDSDRYPELKGIVKTIRQTNGQEAIVLTNGGSIEFIARSKSSGRGFTVDDLVLDEAQELTDEQLEALRPTIAAAPSGDPQTIYLGTPTPPTSPGTVLLRLYRQAHAEKPPKRLAWVEWGVGEVGDPHDRSRWARVNPALGYRLTVEAIEAEATAFSPESFARERLGWWDVHTESDSDLNQIAWAECRTDAPPAKGDPAYAVKFGVDGSRVSLAVCLRPSEGSPHVELIEFKSMKSGVGWLASWLTSPAPDSTLPRWKASLGVVVDGRAGSAALISRLRDAGVDARVIHTPSAAQVGDAVTMFESALDERTVTHFGQPVTDAAAQYAKHRPIGRSGAHGFQSSREAVSTDPLESLALAYWMVRTSKRNPRRIQGAWH